MADVSSWAAKTILSQYLEADVKAGGVLMSGAVELKALGTGLTADDFVLGIRYAVAEGWIDASSPIMLRLTAEGYKQSRRK